jgi:hypothetical protein
VPPVALPVLIRRHGALVGKREQVPQQPLDGPVQPDLVRRADLEEPLDGLSRQLVAQGPASLVLHRIGDPLGARLERRQSPLLVGLDHLDVGVRGGDRGLDDGGVIHLLVAEHPDAPALGHVVECLERVAGHAERQHRRERVTRVPLPQRLEDVRDVARHAALRNEHLPALHRVASGGLGPHHVPVIGDRQLRQRDQAERVRDGSVELLDRNAQQVPVRVVAAAVERPVSPPPDPVAPLDRPADRARGGEGAGEPGVRRLGIQLGQGSLGQAFRHAPDAEVDLHVPGGGRAAAGDVSHRGCCRRDVGAVAATVLRHQHPEQAGFLDGLHVLIRQAAQLLSEDRIRTQQRDQRLRPADQLLGTGHHRLAVKHRLGHVRPSRGPPAVTRSL